MNNMQGQSCRACGPSLNKTFETQEVFTFISCENKVRTGGKIKVQVILSRREDRINKDIHASSRNNLMLPLNHWHVK